MIVTLNEVMQYAEANGCAIGAFNAVNLESIQAILGAAEELDQPVILMHAEVHEEMGLCKMETMAPIMQLLAERASVPVCLHLDHGTSLGYLNRALELGFTSVMYDGSNLDYDRNCANTQIIRAVADQYGASVEAEIGSMGAGESGNGGFADTPVKIMSDGHCFTVPAGEILRLTPGQSISIYCGMYHSFWGEEGSGRILLGEVSQVNDDNADNRFYEEQGRFPEIEEDEAPLCLLCNEYPKAK